MAHGIKPGSKATKNMKNNLLTYFVGDTLKEPVTTDVYEAERYESALIVQQLVGTLVYYSNEGQYEPRLAKKWHQDEDKRWVFVLNKGLTCENNEPITAETYRESLERTIKRIGQNGLPIFDKLIGFEDFIQERKKRIKGLISLDDKIIFNFTEAVNNGLVQMLSFSPFGYISKENLNDDGTWKNNKRFISSGAYRLKDVQLGESYLIEQNPSWKKIVDPNSPKEILFKFSLPTQIDEDGAFIVDIVGWNNKYKEKLVEYKLVPEYLSAILLGNTDNGFFSSEKNRKYLRYLVNKKKSELDWDEKKLIPSDTFYPNQSQLHIPAPNKLEFEKLNPKHQPLEIQGDEPIEGNSKSILWSILKEVLEDNNILYKFNGKSKWQDASDTSVDLRMRQVSIGGGIELWGLNIVFCSELGNKLPDPSREICELIKKADLNQLSFDEFSDLFFKRVIDDSAILPVYHSGMSLYISNRIDLESINPTMNIIKFDHLRLK